MQPAHGIQATSTARIRRTLSRHARRTAFALAMLATAACFRNKPGEEYEEPHEPIPIHVRNENFLDMNIALVVGGVSRRLGTVTGNGSGDFKISWSTVIGQQIVLTATPIGGRGTFTANGVSAGTGQVVEFHIASVLRQSGATVRDPY
jgi:hypothetical protein